MQGKIPEKDFEEIYSQLIEEDRDLIKQFYELDSNFVKNPMYLLKNINKKIERENSTIKVNNFIIKNSWL